MPRDEKWIARALGETVRAANVYCDLFRAKTRIDGAGDLIITDNFDGSEYKITVERVDHGEQKDRDGLASG